MDICLIWAQARKGAIGKDNTLPWHLPEDLRRFKELTQGHCVLMGRKTFESLPNGPLPNRQNIVLSRTAEQPHPRVLRAADMRQALDLAAGLRCARAFVIGGAQVYEQALRIADTAYITEIDIDVPGADAFAPVLPQAFRCCEESPWMTSRHSGVRYRNLRYQRERRY